MLMLSHALMVSQLMWSFQRGPSRAYCRRRLLALLRINMDENAEGGEPVDNEEEAGRHRHRGLLVPAGVKGETIMGF